MYSELIDQKASYEEADMAVFFQFIAKIRVHEKNL